MLRLEMKRMIRIDSLHWPVGGYGQQETTRTSSASRPKMRQNYRRLVSAEYSTGAEV